MSPVTSDTPPVLWCPSPWYDIDIGSVVLVWYIIHHITYLQMISLNWPNTLHQLTCISSSHSGHHHQQQTNHWSNCKTWIHLMRGHHLVSSVEKHVASVLLPMLQLTLIFSVTGQVDPRYPLLLLCGGIIGVILIPDLCQVISNKLIDSRHQPAPVAGQ